jgi:hypothetical protein
MPGLLKIRTRAFLGSRDAIKSSSKSLFNFSSIARPSALSSEKDFGLKFDFDLATNTSMRADSTSAACRAVAASLVRKLRRISVFLTI